jgi:hypothetical protein
LKIDRRTVKKYVDADLSARERVNQ